MARAPMNSETRAKARELFDQGLSRNKIAEALDLDPATITRWARSEGLEFDRSMVKAANEARRADLEAMRGEILIGMGEVAKQELRRAREPYTVFAFGGKSNTYREHELPLPPASDVRSMQTTAAVAFDKLHKALELVPEGTSEAESVLDRLEAEFDDEFTDVDDAEFGVTP